MDVDRRDAIVERHAQQVVDVLGHPVDAADGAVILNSDGNGTAIGVGQSHHGDGQCLGLDTTAFLVVGLPLGLIQIIVKRFHRAKILKLNSDATMLFIASVWCCCILNLNFIA